MTDYNNPLLYESDVISAQQYVDSIAQLRKEAARYRAIREYGLLRHSDMLKIDHELGDTHGETPDEFDASADKLVDVLSAMKERL